MPRGIDRVDRVAVDRVRSTPIGYLELDDSAQVPPGQMVTGDHNLVHVRVLAQWRVDPARVVDFALAGGTIEAVMTQTLEGVLGEWAGARQVDSILLEGKQRLADEVLTEARARLKAQDLGIDLLDLRPELRGADGARQTGIPIWGATSKKLWVQVSGLLTVVAGTRCTDGLTVVGREYGEIYDPTQIQRISADAKITLDVASSGTSQPPSVILPFYPPGSGTPVRYWRLEIAFRRLDLLQFPIVVSGAFY
jgi:hypothetical protein